MSELYWSCAEEEAADALLDLMANRRIVGKGNPLTMLALSDLGPAMVRLTAEFLRCLNPSFSPPSGPLTPTPLLAASASGSQRAVWAGIRARYGGGP